MHRSRTMAALLLVLAVLWGAVLLSGGAAGAQTPSTTAAPTTAPATMPVSPGELPHTGSRDPAGLGLFGFFMVGIGFVTLVGSRRLLTSEGRRR